MEIVIDSPRTRRIERECSALLVACRALKVDLPFDAAPMWERTSLGNRVADALKAVNDWHFAFVALTVEDVRALARRAARAIRRKTGGLSPGWIAEVSTRARSGYAHKHNVTVCTFRRNTAGWSLIAVACVERGPGAVRTCRLIPPYLGGTHGNRDRLPGATKSAPRGRRAARRVPGSPG